MGNQCSSHFSFEPADDLETFCQNGCSYSCYKLKFKLTCTDDSESSCLFNTLSITFLTYCGQELNNFVEFGTLSTVNDKCFTNVTTDIINDGKTLKINFDEVEVQGGNSIDVVLCLKIKCLPCKKPIKVKLETTQTETVSNIIRICQLPYKQCCNTCKCSKTCEQKKCHSKCCH